MRNWSLQAGDPLALTLNADGRLTTPDYINDHIWELELRGGEPRSLTIRTTYGLRARGMRLFFRFSEGGKVVIDPVDFQRAPRVRRFYPNFILLDFVPLEDLEVTAEFWVAESHVLAGRLTSVNQAAAPRQIEFELCGVLTPLDGKTLGRVKHQMINILGGHTSDLHPVVFMGSGPSHGVDPRPSLAMRLEYEARTQRIITWSCAAEPSLQDAFDLARRTVGRPWDAERARIELLDAREVLDIHTGDPDWDAGLAFSQKAAASLLYPAGSHLPRTSFVRTRQPDNGFSRTGDGSDYPAAWIGQAPLDTYYLASQFPASAAIGQGFVENFVAVQGGDGSIDHRPGLAGQRSKLLAMPLLASIAWRAYHDAQDRPFLERVFPRLLDFFNVWFAPGRVGESDGIPQWQELLQTGFEDNPLFDVWYPWSQSLSMSALFNPELEGLLAHEAASLLQMAAVLGHKQVANSLRSPASRLSSSLEAAWNPRTSLYAYRDRRTSASWVGQLLSIHRGSGEFRPRTSNFDAPVRLLLQVVRKSPASGTPVIEISGRGPASGPGGPDVKLSERIQDAHFRWHTGGLVATTANVYRRIDSVSIQGAQESDRLVVRVVDTTGEDITLFTPLWAHAPSPDQARAIRERLFGDAEPFNRPFGIPALPASPASPRAGAREKAEADTIAMSVHLPWNQLVAEGLLAYGFRDEAARLVTRMMSAVVKSLKQDRAFYEHYHADTGIGLGERGAVTGLAPVGLLLQTLGVQIISPTSVRLEGRNPFPWPVTLAYRDLKITRGLDRTEVAFGNGQVTQVTDPSPCIVSL